MTGVQTCALPIYALEAKRLAKDFPMVVAAKVDAKTGGLYGFAESFDLETPYNRTI